MLDIQTTIISKYIIFHLLFLAIFSTILIALDTCESGGMADALDSGSSGRKVVWVQIPSLAPRVWRFSSNPFNFDTFSLQYYWTK
jgi:hypothetical protein